MVAVLDGEAGDDRRPHVEIERLEEMFAAPAVETVPRLATIAFIDTRLGPGDTMITTVTKPDGLHRLMGRISTRKTGLQRFN